ncbi:sensor histidine kinase [Blastococcus sp. SYSU D00695]
MPPPDREVPSDSEPASDREVPPDRAAASGGRLEETLHALVRAAVEHAGARYGALGVLSPDGRQLDRFVVVGTSDADAARIGRLPSDGGTMRVLVEDPAPPLPDGGAAHPAPVGGPPGQPPMRAFLGVPVRTGESVFGHLYLTDKRDGGDFTTTDEEVVLALTATAGLAVENARLAEEADHRRAWATAGAAVATSLLSGGDPEQVLREVAEGVAELAGADLCGVVAPVEDEEDVFRVVAAAGEAGADAEGVRLPLAGTRLEEAHRAGVPVLIDDITAVAERQAYAPVVRELVAAGYGPGLIVPLGGRPAAATIVALRREGRPAFDRPALEGAAAFASRVGVALELARSQRRERDLRLVADRDRIARDLHDHVVQRIYATGLALDRIGRSLTEQAPEASARIAERVDELDETIARIREAIFELHDGETTRPAALRARLAEVVRSVTEGRGLRVTLRVRDGSADLPAALVHDVVAVVRELVTNVVRHAAATRVTAEVRVDSEVTVEVTDDGRGMPAVAARSGLANLTDRAERRGGGLTVTAGPPGTAIRWSVPRSES